MRRTTAGLISVALISLTGCAHAPPPIVATPNLPDPPEKFGKRVELPIVHSGQKWFNIATEHRLALIEANQRLDNDRAFYEDVREGWSGVR